MPVQIQIKATDNLDNDWRKGFIVQSRDEPVVWGDRDGLPDFVIVRIGDATEVQVSQFVGAWKNVFSYQQTDLLNGFIQITASIDSEIPVKTGKELKAVVRDFIVAVWGGTIVNFSITHVTFNIVDTIDIPVMKADFLDKVEEQVDVAMYRFSDADVDLAIAAGGFIELTKAQALNRIIDRRDP